MRRRNKSYLDRRILTRTDQKPRIRTPRKPINRTNMAPQRSHKLSRLTLPQPHAIIKRRARCPPPIRTERHMGHLTLMTGETSERF